MNDFGKNDGRLRPPPYPWVVQQDIDPPDTSDAAEIALKHGPGAINMKLGYVDFARKKERGLTNSHIIEEPTGDLTVDMQYT